MRELPSLLGAVFGNSYTIGRILRTLQSWLQNRATRAGFLLGVGLRSPSVAVGGARSRGCTSGAFSYDSALIEDYTALLRHEVGKVKFGSLLNNQ